MAHISHKFLVASLSWNVKFTSPAMDGLSKPEFMWCMARCSIQTTLQATYFWYQCEDPSKESTIIMYQQKKNMKPKDSGSDQYILQSQHYKHYKPV
jgi:hypothetical protein